MAGQLKLPSMTDARLCLASQALTRLTRAAGGCKRMRTRSRMQRLHETLEWAQAAYDVLTAFLTDIENRGYTSALNGYVSRMRLLVRPDDVLAFDAREEAPNGE